MHKYLRYGYIENLDTVRRLPVGRLLGVQVSVTPIIWLFPFIFFGLRLVQGAFGPLLSLADGLVDAGLFVVAVALATLVHGLGHILGGLVVRRPMDELLFTVTRGTNLYFGDQSVVPGYAHISRSLGGPALNLLAAAVFSLLAPAIGEGPLLNHLIGTNMFLGLGGLLPLPSLDGWVIWREVALWVQERLVR